MINTNSNKNGGLFTYTHFNNKVVGIVSLSCETDFAAKTDVFKILGEHLAMQVACSDVETVDEFQKLECVFGDDSEGVINDSIGAISKKLKEKVEILKIQKIEF